MIQGTASDVGKSLLAAALCRIYARRGFRVAPFKSQNMSLNSYAGPDGAEIGRAQALQAMAAGRVPEADMNPVLLKPEADSRSQVVVMGRPWKTLDGRDYLSMRERVWPVVTSAMDRLLADNDLVIAEGAGSPAEINLNDREIVNMSIAAYLDAPVLLAADIDRGGVFASIVGTLALLDEEGRRRVKGFLINKFRGDISLLSSGLDMLAERTGGRPTLAVIPWIHELHLANEDSVVLEGLQGLGDYR
ncbi:MAG: cobyric acid synthase, partial [Spirochaetaceae bacterium]|nr:cobyric acid synthase [Spirochaetaceae bacterium]